MTTASAQFVTITPRMAEKYLEAHQDVVRESGLTSLNRIINDNTVTQYATDMTNGEWVENGETIKIAASGRVVDGQHRLWACVNSGKSFRSLLVTGFKNEEVNDVFVTTDIGRSKNPGAFLSASGVQYAGFVAPACRYLIAYKEYKSLTKTHMITTPMIVEFGKSHSSRLVDSALAASKNLGYVPGSILTAWHYLFAEKNIEQAAKFITDLKDGVGLSKGDPIHTLRERLIQNKANKNAKLQAKSMFALGIHIWNDVRKGSSRTIIKQPQMDYAKLPKIL